MVKVRINKIYCGPNEDITFIRRDCLEEEDLGWETVVSVDVSCVG